MHFLLEPLLRLFANLVSHGGQPRLDRNQDGPVLIYPLRPGTLLFVLLALVFFVWVLATDLPLLLRGSFRSIRPFPLVVALVVGPLAIPLLTRTLSLDEEGLHLRSFLGRDTSIAWNDLHQVERYQSRSAGKSTWYLRSADNRTTITLPEMTYNTDHLLRTIRERVPLPEHPRQRRHWYGG